MKHVWRIKKYWIVTVFLKDYDENGEPLNWTDPIEEYALCKTYEEALSIKEKLLSGQDYYYGNNIEEVHISDDPEEREILVDEDEARRIDLINAIKKN